MKKMNVNVAGNINLFVPVLPNRPDEVRDLLVMYQELVGKDPSREMRAFLDFMNDFLEECEAQEIPAGRRDPKEEEKETECGEEERVLVIQPRKEAVLMTPGESEEILERFGMYHQLGTLPELGLMIHYDERQLLRLGGESYLLGPAVIYECSADADPVSMDADRVQQISRIFQERTVQLHADGRDFPVFRM
ncbi:MAG: hypothetical protein ACI4D3_09980 [Lachnospiraceae bacterium]